MMMIRNHRESLKVAMERGAIPAAIDALVGIAQELMEQGDRERAVEILAMVLHYPMNRETREVADFLFDDLEAALCPRLIFDARARTDELTLDDLALQEISKIEE